MFVCAKSMTTNGFRESISNVIEIKELSEYQPAIRASTESSRSNIPPSPLSWVTPSQTETPLYEAFQNCISGEGTALVTEREKVCSELNVSFQFSFEVSYFKFHLDSSNKSISLAWLISCVDQQ